MATTTNTGAKKIDQSEQWRNILGIHNDTVDAYDEHINSHSQAMNKSVCPIITGANNDSGVAIASGEYFCVADGTNDGLYLATAAIGTGVAWSGKGTLQSAHGGLNALNSKLTQIGQANVFALKSGTTGSTKYSSADISNEITVPAGYYLAIMSVEELPTNGYFVVRYTYNGVIHEETSKAESFAFFLDCQSEATVKFMIKTSVASAVTYTFSSNWDRATLIRLR